MIELPCRVCCKAVCERHRAIECDLCKAWNHIWCNRLDQNDYKFDLDYSDDSFYCIKCLAENITFSTLNDNQFEICVKKGINHLMDDDVGLKPSATEQQLFNKLNYAISSNAFDLTEENNEDNNDISIACKYYSAEEFVSSKFNSAKTLIRLNIHSIEKHIDELRVVLALLEFKFLKIVLCTGFKVNILIT